MCKLEHMNKLKAHDSTTINAGKQLKICPCNKTMYNEIQYKVGIYSFYPNWIKYITWHSYKHIGCTPLGGMQSYPNFANIGLLENH